MPSETLYIQSNRTRHARRFCSFKTFYANKGWNSLDQMHFKWNKIKREKRQRKWRESYLTFQPVHALENIAWLTELVLLLVVAIAKCQRVRQNTENNSKAMQALRTGDFVLLFKINLYENYQKIKIFQKNWELFSCYLLFRVLKYFSFTTIFIASDTCHVNKLFFVHCIVYWK